MNRPGSTRRRAEQIRRERARSQNRAGPDGNGAIIRLVICGVIFVLLVAAKLLFPETADSLTRTAGKILGRNADFKEAFAAMGRAISGEESVGNSLQDAYTAVFNPAGPDAEPVPDAKAEPSRQSSRTSLKNWAGPARLFQPDLPAINSVNPENQNAVTETVIDLDTGETSESTRARTGDAADFSETLSWVCAMPDNASLEQRNLGFEYSSPICGPLSSAFGWREHPVEGGSKFHYGVDLAAEEGAEITAFAAGSVYATGESSTLGNYIMLQHEGGYITLYAHCSKVTAISGSVAMGEKIAEVGSTGLATGPHLHFELHDGDLYLNPVYYVDVG